MNERVATAPVAKWNYNMKECQPATKCLLLTTHNVAVIGQINGDATGYKAWSPLSQRNKKIEKELGYL